MSQLLNDLKVLFMREFDALFIEAAVTVPSNLHLEHNTLEYLYCISYRRSAWSMKYRKVLSLFVCEKPVTISYILFSSNSWKKTKPSIPSFLMLYQHTRSNILDP